MSLTALELYYADTYFEWLNQNKDDVIKRVSEFFELVKPNLTYMNSYIIDFVVFPDSVRVVELNPFSLSTGSCLFNWKEDSKVLHNGPFEFRLNKAPHSDNTVLGHLLPWKDLLAKAKAELPQDSSCFMQ